MADDKQARKVAELLRRVIAHNDKTFYDDRHYCLDESLVAEINSAIKDSDAAQAAPVAAIADVVKYTRLARGIQNPAGHHENGPWEDFYACDDVVRALAAHTQQPAAVPAEQDDDERVSVQKSLLLAACAEIRKYAIPAGADDQVVLNIEAACATPTQPPAGELPVLPECADELAEADGFNVIGTVEVFTAEQMREYGHLCRAEGIEEAAKLVASLGYEESVATAIRALTKTGAA